MYQDVGQAVVAALGSRSQVWLAEELGIDGAYLNRILKGKQKPSEALLREIADALGQPAKAAEWIALLGVAIKARKARRQERRQRHPLDVTDGPAMEVTDAERAQIIGVLQAMGVSRAKALAVVTTANECYQAPTRRAA